MDHNSRALDGKVVFQAYVGGVQRFLVIVIGGGPAGCATALSLCRHSERRSFLLLDDSHPSTFKVCVIN